MKEKNFNTIFYTKSNCILVSHNFGKVCRKKSFVSAQDRTGDLLRSKIFLLGRRDNRYTTETMGKTKNLKIHSFC